jgi:hypothetical protein
MYRDGPLANDMADFACTLSISTDNTSTVIPTPDRVGKGGVLS